MQQEEYAMFTRRCWIVAWYENDTGQGHVRTFCHELEARIFAEPMMKSETISGVTVRETR